MMMMPPPQAPPAGKKGGINGLMSNVMGGNPAQDQKGLLDNEPYDD